MISIENMRCIRKRRKMTQQELADKTGISRVCINRYESGKSTPRLGKMVKLASALNVTVDELLDESKNQ